MPARPPSPGAPFDVFGLELEQLLGAGAFAQVYLSHLLLEDEKKMVAVKVESTGAHVDTEVANLKYLRSFEHPNVVNFLGSCVVSLYQSFEEFF